ncbi:GntR family transcriptional regulator [Oceaniglobus ichthyenteri]|uniref:GntR family transcriptional regulator n=1 Tax=Oceaniglobus ichthyenteri TaxID=2136177 RepID=UPI000D3707CB|nr:GntR family transcriptional regulator [Oceaniglobus ichthyenteri]
MNDENAKLPAAEQAYLSIRRAIITGGLTQGERLTEQRLAADLSLSRTPVREAISRLILEGFVEKQEGYSTRVAGFQVDEMAQIFEIRRLLEGYAARRAAKLATPDQIAALRQLCDEMARHTPPKSQHDYEQIAAANERFHRIIAEAARSPRLLALLSVAVDVGMVVRTYHLYSEADLQRSLGHHRELTDAIAARGETWAENVMSAHIMAAASVALAHQPAPPTD